MATFRSHPPPARPVAIAVLAVASAWLALVPELAGAQALTPTVPVSAEDLESGRTLHERHCAVCHGIDGRGDTPAVRNQGSQPADHTDERAMAAFTDQQLAARIQHGAYQMPAFPEIRGDELVALVAFVRSQSMGAVHAVELQQLAQGVVPDFEPVTDEMLVSPAPEDWLMYRRTYDSWAYSPLEQIDRDSVDRLELAWSWAMTSGRQYITPLAYGGVLYIESPRDILQALDAKTGDLIWEYRWQPPDEASAVAPGTHVRGTRSIAIHGERLYHLTADAHLIAVNARTGTLDWAVPETGREGGITHSAGPIIVDGKVISGRGAAPRGGPEVSYIAAHDAETGRELWRFHTIPAPGEHGDESWQGVPWEDRQHVGSWDVGSYDPELGLLYWGTSVPSPSLESVRGTDGGDVLYSNSTLALDPETGKLRWYYQHLPRDNWDLDHVFERLLVDTAISPNADEVRWINPRLNAGERRRVVTGIPGKTGIVYTLDAATGEFLWARETIHQNVIADIDAATGRVTIDEAMVPQPFTELLVCPGNAGGKNWMGGAYSPRTGLMYHVMLNACTLQRGTTDAFRRGLGYAVSWVMVEDPALAGRDPYPVGRLDAIAVDDGRTAWRHERRAGLVSGLVATAGGLVFGGDANRRFMAFDDRSGDVLWEKVLSAPVTGHPISFAVDGEQYIAVAAGGNTHVDRTALSLHPEIKVPQGFNTLFVFRLRPLDRATIDRAE